MTKQERIARAEADSLRVEREAGLRFSEFSMLPGYHYDHLPVPVRRVRRHQVLYTLAQGGAVVGLLSYVVGLVVAIVGETGSSINVGGAMIVFGFLFALVSAGFVSEFDV